MIKWVPLRSNSEIWFFETTCNPAQTQTPQDCKAASPTTGTGQDTKLNFYHLKNQIKIRPFAITQEHYRERQTRTSSLHLTTHMVTAGGFGCLRKVTTVTGDGCHHLGCDSNSTPDTTQQGHPQAGTQGVGMPSAARHQGA